MNASDLSVFIVLIFLEKGSHVVQVGLELSTQSNLLLILLPHFSEHGGCIHVPPHSIDAVLELTVPRVSNQWGGAEAHHIYFLLKLLFMARHASFS